ncbi:Predicted flavoprotein CzcO associated with the cation diffusion facilitator CzcD [Novosphingobium sp. CF614]|uniref:flavin-containing monooxygenase n=1 Tax=Novosphingobium sp. CF614 TaxID=1884364 RepID=UPI0008E41816|nr:NAD(P)/FAD-dependent oxidoreductase [Novosphingobium sp. CF614]SFG26670.1 Predicted flavoprotein CzcO associated with the cation diffusion facilitator CzcD [Novosphingobium sp. CF614]
MNEVNAVGDGEVTCLDAAIIGTGFSGLYALKKLRDDVGLNALAFDKAGGIGGTWHWNRYPGALSDSESHVYCYSWDTDLLRDWDHHSKYITQPEILRYLEHVAERHGLYGNIRLNTGVTSALFDDDTKRWILETDTGQRYSAKYLITAVGLLSATNIPKFEGIESFRGKIYHTSRWPDDAGIEGKRVGVVGTGSTGVQLITAIAPVVGHLTVFQRSPQYSVPVGNGPLSRSELAEIKNDYPRIWEAVRKSALAFGFPESDVPVSSVSAEERERIFDRAWEKGGGFRFMFETFCDIATDEGANKAANKAAQDYIRRKIDEIVKDPETARKLKPKDLYAKRPLCDSGYYRTFNRDNVELVHIGENPITAMTPKGVKTADGVEHELDILVFATGFDAVDGNYKRMDLRGRKGVRIQDHWKDGPSAYLSLGTSGFPNMFMVLGPNGPFTNLPPSIETEVEWIAQAIDHMERNGYATIEPASDAEAAWTRTCAEIASQTLFPKADSWIFGANIPGKKNTIYFYMGGLGAFRETLANVVQDNYRGFKLEKESESELVD